MNTEGKIILITGASSGIGKACAIQLAAHGAHVILQARGEEALKEVANIIESNGGKASVYPVDLSDFNQINNAAERIKSEVGVPDVIINNAGMGPAVPSPDVPETLFDSVVNLNFKGPFRLASIVGKKMKAAGSGSIINISSSGALQPLPNVVPYGSSKAALNAMTVSLAHEFSPEVRVNAISAGPFLTDIAKAWTPEAREKSDNAAGRPGNPDEIVTAALYLASPASSFTTGSIIRVDGGMH